MKKLKFPSGIIALLTGLTVAVFTQSFKAENTEQWGLNGNTWQKISDLPAYQCTSVVEPPICTAYFPENVDPNEDASAATEVINGRLDIILNP